MRKNKRTPLQDRPNKPVTVLVAEEFGWRHYLWQPDMTPKALVRWWRTQEHPPSPYTDFPGWIHPVWSTNPEDRDERRFVIGSKEKGWSEFTIPEDAWYIHTHDDDDSVLIAPGWMDEEYTRYFHRGHKKEGE